jgi:hypothetical protein
MFDEFISRKSNIHLRWAWEQTENCKLCSFIEKCSAFRTIVYDPPELDAQYKPRWLKRENLKWPIGQWDDVIVRLVFDRASGGDCSLEPSRSFNTRPHSLIGCTAVAGHIGAEDRSGPVRVIPPQVQSFDFFKTLIKICQERHFCKLHGEGSEPPRSIPNMLLIDCESRQVVTAPQHCWYLALSYVWGSHTARPMTLGETLSSLPRTIEDAIIVTLKLGYRYLWVDMYCIRQDDQKHLNDQLRHMDLVYRRAQVTFVAATGDNPNFGLAGVSSPRLTRQAHTTINGVSFANFSHNPWGLVDSSAWNSRAWTFQESLFSRRRIFFTAEQTIFNCSHQWCCESIRAIETRVPSDIHQIRNWMVPKAPPMFGDESSSSKNMIHRLIQQYSHRRLTFSNDILNAFSGVLHAYGNLDVPVRNLWGIPILLNDSSVLKSFNIGLSWEFSNSTGFSLKSRREAFPSWSWTGWEHPVHYRDEFVTTWEYLPPLELVVAIEVIVGSKLQWMELQHAVMNCPGQLSDTKYIRLEAWSTSVMLHYSFKEIEDRASTLFNSVCATIGPDGHKWQFRAQVSIDQKIAEQLESVENQDDSYLCRGIFLGGFKKYAFNSLHDEHLILLVAKKGEFWERIGIAYLGEATKVFPLRWIDPLHLQSNQVWEKEVLGEWMKNHLQLRKEVIVLG